MFGIWPHTDIHTHASSNAVTLVWGSLRLAPIIPAASCRNTSKLVCNNKNAYTFFFSLTGRVPYTEPWVGKSYIIYGWLLLNEFGFKRLELR